MKQNTWLSLSKRTNQLTDNHYHHLHTGPSEYTMKEGEETCWFSSWVPGMGQPWAPLFLLEQVESIFSLLPVLSLQPAASFSPATSRLLWETCYLFYIFTLSNSSPGPWRSPVCPLGSCLNHFIPSSFPTLWIYSLLLQSKKIHWSSDVNVTQLVNHLTSAWFSSQKILLSPQTSLNL